jgi:predicted cobalt transporter CbtA
VNIQSSRIDKFVRDLMSHSIRDDIRRSETRCQFALGIRDEAGVHRIVIRAPTAWRCCRPIVVMAGIVFALPNVNEVPEDFPATVLWQFRIASLGGQLIMWTTLGLLFGVVAERLFAQYPSTS